MSQSTSRLLRRPSAAAIVLALFLAGAGHLINSYGVVGPLGSFTDYLKRSLESFDALRVGGVFYFELTGCEVRTGGGFHGVECTQSYRAPGSSESVVAYLGKAVVNTAEAIWNGSTGLGLFVYAAALLASAWWLTARLYDGEDSVFSLPFWLGLLVLTPALASLTALGLKWLLLLFVLLFSQVLAGVVWVLATFGGLIAWLGTGWSVFSKAQQIDTLGINAQPSSDVSRKPPTGR